MFHKFGSFLALFGAALIASSCGHAEASHPAVAMGVVMKTIHDYGRDHNGLLAPGTVEKPDEAVEVYSARIGRLLV